MTFPEPQPQETAEESPAPDPTTDTGSDSPLPEQEVLGEEEPETSSPGKAGGSRNKISRWLEKRAARVVGKVYEERAEDLQARAARTIGTVYEERADELEDRAVNAMRRAIEAESDRIRIAIEHGVAVKKREVRLSLLVLAVSSTIYLVLYYLTR